MIEKWVQSIGKNVEDLVGDDELISQLEKDGNLKKELGEFTHKDIASSLKAPSQDPRTAFEASEFRDDVMEITDLKAGSWYPGIVTNITQFGAFVDIGIKENGLLHISQIADKFVENALNELTVGQKLKVRVLEVDLERKRISLSCKKEEAGYVDRSQPTSSSKKKGSNRSHRAPDKLRNNAFAALKGLKIDR